MAGKDIKKEVNKTQPFAFATSTGSIATKDIYKQYIIEGETSPTDQLTDDYFAGMYDGKGLIKPLYNPKQLAGLLEINTYHNRCVRTKAQDVAGNGYELKKTRPDADEKDKERIKKFFDEQDPPLEEILTKTEIDYGSIGYNFIELVKEGNRSDTKYKYMNHAPAHTVRVSREKILNLPKKYAQKRGGKTVWFKNPLLDKDVDKETGEEYKKGTLDKEKRANDMIMMKEYSPSSDFYGVPGVVNSLGAIWGNLAQQRYNNEFFKNHGIPQYAVYITGDYSLEEGDDGVPVVVKKIKEYLSQVRKNPHSTLVFGIPSGTPGMGENVKVHFEPLATETKDASFRMFRKDNRDEVIISHAVPGNRIGLGDVGSLGGDTAYETNRIYKESVINPRQFEIEEYINTYIIKHNFGIDGWRFKLRTIDVDSKEKDKDILEFLFERGGATPNDLIRNLGSDYGIEPSDSEGMDEYYINGQPISKLMSNQPSPVTMSKKSISERDKEELLRMIKNRQNLGDK